MHKALVDVPDLNKETILKCYHEYMKFSVEHPPTQKMYLLNMEAKMQDDEFTGDITGLIRPTENYDQQVAYEMVSAELLEKLDETNPAKQTKTKKA